jgi:hypothetical protein
MERLVVEKYVPNNATININLHPITLISGIKITGLKPECEYILNYNDSYLSGSHNGRIEYSYELELFHIEALLFQSICRCGNSECVATFTIYYNK